MISSWLPLLLTCALLHGADGPAPIPRPTEGIETHRAMLQHYSDNVVESAALARSILDDIATAKQQGSLGVRFANPKAMQDTIRLLAAAEEAYRNDPAVTVATRREDLRVLRDAGRELNGLLGARPADVPAAPAPVGAPGAAAEPPRRTVTAEEIAAVERGKPLEAGVARRVILWAEGAVRAFEGQDEAIAVQAWTACVGAANPFDVPQEGLDEARALFADPVCRAEQLAVLRAIIAHPGSLRDDGQLTIPGGRRFPMAAAVVEVPAFDGKHLIRLIMRDDHVGVFSWTGKRPQVVLAPFRDVLSDQEWADLVLYLESIASACDTGRVEDVMVSWFRGDIGRLDAQRKEKFAAALERFGLPQLQRIVCHIGQSARGWRRNRDRQGRIKYVSSEPPPDLEITLTVVTQSADGRPWLVGIGIGENRKVEVPTSVFHK